MIDSIFLLIYSRRYITERQEIQADTVNIIRNYHEEVQLLRVTKYYLQHAGKQNFKKGGVHKCLKQKLLFQDGFHCLEVF